MVSSPRRSPRIRLLREMLSSSSTETPQVRRSPRGLSRRSIRETKTEAHGSGSVLGKRARPRDYATDSTPSKRSKDCFDIETTTESAIEMYQETLNFTCYSDESNLPVVIVTPKLIHCVSGVGEIARVRLVVRSTGNYCVQVCLL